MNVNGYKNIEDTQKKKHLLRERLEFRLGTVSDTYHWGAKTWFISAQPHPHPICPLQNEQFK